ncbi:hypothetical protein EV06_1031 [Prochlorococcus sp. MIT 0602]|nr:hypothetical protein EV06_1031 [Prochlorococcus sp. MIT 0602]
MLMEIAQACDYCLKPWRHSVIDISCDSIYKTTPEAMDLTLRVESRSVEGQRYPEHDLEVEIFKSGNDLSITLSWAAFPDKPILWHGKHSIWMDSISGMRSHAPDGGSSLEALARRLRSSLLIE